MAKIYLLNNLKYDGVENLEVFSIKYIPSQVNLLEYDALIFTSKNAIYSIDSFNKDWRKIESYAIAPKTAQIINKYSSQLAFTGKTSHGNEFAKELAPLLVNKKVLYIKAQKTVSNLVDILKEKNINIDELVTYETICKTSSETLDDDSVFIFTSPSSVKCFFKNYTWKDSYKAVVIGKTTAKYIPNEIKYFVSKKTSIEECINLAQELLL